MQNINYKRDNFDISSHFIQALTALIFSAAAGLVMPAMAWAGSYDAFFKAVNIDDADTLVALLQRGLDPNIVEAVRGDTGLILALREDSMRAFEALLASPDILLEQKARNGDTALMMAAFKANIPAVKALLAKGAEVNRPGWTPLHYAAASGNNDIVQLLLDKYAYIDAESPNKTTPIMMAVRNGHILTVKLLMDAGADATLKNDQGMSAIDFAKKFEQQEIADGIAYRLNKQRQEKQDQKNLQPLQSLQPSAPSKVN